MTKEKRKRIFGIFLIIVSICSLYFVPWRIVRTWIRPLPATVQAQVESAIDDGFDGMIAYVDLAGQPPQYFAAGWHDRDAKLPANPLALFKIASISKLYDAVAATKLVSRGRLSLDKTVDDYLPNLVESIENTDKITLRMLMQHRSGIPNFTDAPGFWGNPTETFDESLALIRGKPANFAPGASYEYCNTNYLLLNRIMDDVLGYGNFRFIQEEVLTPLKLTHTFSSLSEVDIADVMSGYHVGYPHDIKTEDFGMHATAEDVGTFLRALNDGSLLTPAEQDLYTALYEYEHGGWVPGYQSFANYDKDLDAVIVTFYSTTDSKLYNWNLSEIINGRIVKILRRQTCS